MEAAEERGHTLPGDRLLVAIWSATNISAIEQTLQLLFVSVGVQIKYRPDIDGLRTIAVFSVIVYHAKITVSDSQLLPGGYLGVDIFFVISGYLITTLLMKELVQSGQISILNFYERRARRLLPGLLVVMLASLPFAWHFLLPEQLVDFSRSLIFSLLFSSNFYWDYSLQQYGAESALLKPFLHTWSLAVEEQYYLVFPLVLFAIYKWCRRYLAVILSMGFLLSLLFAQWKTGQNQSFSFYMLPTRFWELLAGSLLALLVLRDSPTALNSMLCKTLPSIGLLLILSSLALFGFGVHHPGFVTLLPVLGTMLIIAFKRKGDWVTRALSRPTMVYLGLLSYSLYLWHYPIFAFGRMVDTTPSLANKGVWLAITLALSAVSYHLLEKPFRSKRVSRKALVFILLSASGLVMLVSLYWIKGDGIPDRGDYLQGLIQSVSRNIVRKDGEDCQSGNPGGRAFPISESCIFEFSPGSPTLVLVGDSHAGALAESVKALARENELNYAQVTATGCPHLAGLQYGGHLSKGLMGILCRNRGDTLRSFLRELSEPIVIYNSRLPLYLELERFDNQEGGLEDGDKVSFSEEESPGEKATRSRAIVSTLNGWVEDGYSVVIVYPVPEQGFHVNALLTWNSPPITSIDQLPTFSTSYDVFKKRVASSYLALNQVKDTGVKRVYPENIFCREDTGRCIASEADRLYFLGDNHVSVLGANLIVREVAAQLNLKVPDSFRK